MSARRVASRRNALRFAEAQVAGQSSQPEGLGPVARDPPQGTDGVLEDMSLGEFLPLLGMAGID